MYVSIGMTHENTVLITSQCFSVYIAITDEEV